MDFTGWNFTKCTVVQRIFLDISCIECYPKLKKITEHEAKFHLRPNVMWAVYYIDLRPYVMLTVYYIDLRPYTMWVVYYIDLRPYMMWVVYYIDLQKL